MRNINFKGVLIFAILMVSGVIPNSFAAIEVLEIFHASNQNCDGSFLIEASGDAGTFTVIVSDDTGSTVSTFSDVNGEIEVSNLCSGLYTIEVRNAYECVTTLSATIVACPEIKLEGLEDAIEHPTTCNVADGSFYFRFGGPTGGTGPYTMTLYDNEGNIIPRFTFELSWSGLPAGVYTFLVEDANGCTGEFEVELVPQLGAMITDYLIEAPCQGEANGSIEIFVIGATTYTINWSNGETGAEIENLTAGTYCVTVSDGICNSEECYTISDLDLQFLNITSAYITDECTGASNGAIDIVSIEGGKQPYNYLWSNGQGTDLDLTGIPTGEYCLTVTDACNATVVECYAVRDVPSLSVSGTVVSDACLTINEYDMFSVPKGGIDIEIAGGNAGYQIQWSHDSNYTGKKPRGLDPGTYCVTVTGAVGGCGVVSECYTVNERPTPDILVVDLQQCDDDDCTEAFIDIDVINGNGPFSYEWTSYLGGGGYFSSDTEDISNLPGTGSYRVRVSSANDCPVEKSIDIESCKDVELPSFGTHYTVPASELFPLGGIDISVLPEDQSFSYTWEGPDSFTSNSEDLLEAAGPGSYSVTIHNGCEEITETFTIDSCSLELEVAYVDDACSAEGLAVFAIYVHGTQVDDEFWFFNPNTLSFQPTVETYLSPDTTRLEFRGGEGNIPVGIINQDGCGGIINVTILPSSIHAEEFEYISMASDYSNGTYIPLYCHRAVECNGFLAADEIIDEYTFSADINPNDAQKCTLTASCSTTSNSIEGSVTESVNIAPDGVTCEEGTYCIGTWSLSNPEYTRYLDLRDIDRDELYYTDTIGLGPNYTVALAEPLSIQNVYPASIETSVHPQTQECIETKYCNGLLVETRGVGFQRTVREWRVPPFVPESEGSCWEVTYCGTKEVSAVETDLAPYLCPGVSALQGDPNSNTPSSAVELTFTSRIKSSPESTPSIQPTNVSMVIDQLAPPKSVNALKQDSDRLNGIHIFPNPTKNEVFIQLSTSNTFLGEDFYEIVVTNILGKEMLRRSTGDDQVVINLGFLTPGHYVIKITGKEGRSISHQIIKQ